MAASSIAYEGDSFRRFLSWTDEKEILGKEISGLVKPTHKSLLEVGAGNGDVTTHYINSFAEAILIEPAQRHYEQLVERFPGAKVIRGKAEEFKSNGAYFDLIVASHVFIYVKRPLDTLDHLFSVLRDGGRFIIVMVNKNCGYTKFVGHFYDKVITGPAQSEGARWDVFVSHMASKGMTYQVKDAVSFITAPSIDSFLSVNDFHFNTDVSQLDEIVLGEMRRYLERYVVHNVLKIDAGHKLIVIEK